MIFIFMASAISMVLVMIRVRNYESFKQKLKDHEKANKTKINKTKGSFSFYLSYFIGLIFVLLFMMFVYADSVRIGELGINLAVSFSVCMISLFTAELLWGGWKVRLYYDDQGFFIKQSYFHFKNVKEIVELDKRKGLGIVLRNGKIVKVNASQAEQLRKLLHQRSI